jgi:hypothetical protein
MNDDYCDWVIRLCRWETLPTRRPMKLGASVTKATVDGRNWRNRVANNRRVFRWLERRQNELRSV